MESMKLCVGAEDASKRRGTAFCAKALVIPLLAWIDRDDESVRKFSGYYCSVEIAVGWWCMGRV